MSFSPTQPTFYWHDYETFGIDARRDRPAQFAGQRTTLDLEPIGAPLTLYCRPAPDVLPQPQSCLITGITPQRAERDGVNEAEFAARVIEELGTPGTCGAGYNTIRFDDEFTRNLLYRNFYDPYEREWKDDNARWDIIDLARMCYALRPAGMEWPRHPDGAASFRLEDLSVANGLAHAQAHDALSDVQATIGLARRLKQVQPKLWDFYFGLRRKRAALALLDWAQRTPVLHVSARFGAERGCCAVVVPLAQHPTQPNKIVVYDLDVEPTPLLTLDAEEIAARVFTARANLPEGVERVPLKLVHANRSPALAPLSVLKGTDTARIGLDVERAQRHLAQINAAPNLAEKLRHVYGRATAPDAAAPDPELAIYAGFCADSDKRVCAAVRATPRAELGRSAFEFRDARYAELLFRYRARNFPDTLDAAERARWREFCRRRLSEQTPLTGLTFDAFRAELARLRSDPALGAAQRDLLDELDRWGDTLAAGLVE